MRSNKMVGSMMAVATLILPMLAACAKTDQKSVRRVPVAIHGLNHTGDPYTFFVKDPLDGNNRASGETINAFEGGGSLCCYELPAKWRPGIRVEVGVISWLPETPDQKLPEVRQTHILEIPEYPAGKVAELWIVRTSHRDVTIVSSNVQPDHPQWPGRIKGWPVPDLAFRKILYENTLKQARADVLTFERLVLRMDETPLEHAKEAWPLKMMSEPDSLRTFKGAEDPAFHHWLRKQYSDELLRSKEDLKKTEAARL